MVEPVYKWHPVTEEYKNLQAQSADFEAETQQKLRELQEQAAKPVWVEKKAPIGIRVFTWYLFCRAGFYALLFTILGVFPQSAPSTWMVTNLGHFMRLPGAAARERAAKQREFLREHGIDPDAMPGAVAGQDSEEASQQRQREEMMVYFFILAVLTTVVGLMWWNHSWKIRWVAMFYSGAFVAKAGVGLFAGWASGVGTQLAPDEMSALMLAIAVNGFIFCYLAFWPEVQEWFEDQP